MPYSNMPQSMWNKMDRCVADVQKQGNDKKKSIAICYTSLTKGKELATVIKEFNLTQKASDNSKDYLIVEDSKKPTTWHLQVRTNGKPDHRLMGAAWAALHGGYRGNIYEGPNKQQAISELKRLYESEQMPVPTEKEINLRVCTLKAITDAPNLRDESMQNCANCKYFTVVPSDDMMMMPEEGICTEYEFETDAEWVCDSWAMIEPTITTMKQSDGHYRWVLFSSSSFQDRDGEIVSQKALETDTDRMNTTKEFGTLDWWHTPIVLGDCDFSMMHGRISIESGTFRDDFIGEKFESMKELGASRTFFNPTNEPDAQGVFHNIRTFSRAILPAERASNRLTLVDVSAKEKQMSIMDKAQELVKKLGGTPDAEKKVQELLQAAEHVEKAATDAGLTSKEAEQTPESKGGDPVSTPAQEEAKPVFAGDLPLDEFKTLLNEAVTQFLTPAIKELGGAIARMNDDQNKTTKEQGDKVATSIKSIQDMQTELAARLAALEGLTPRGYRPTQDPTNTVSKEVVDAKTPKGDATATHSVDSWLEKNLTGRVR